MEPLDKRTLGEIADELDSQDIPPWEVLPDLELYMDQVITLFGQRFEPLAVGNDRPLTSSMINNYVKDEVMPRPLKKKYTREHLTALSVICMLKAEFSLPEIRALLNALGERYSTEELYTAFQAAQTAALHNAADELRHADTIDSAARLELAMSLALEANAKRVAASKLLATALPMEEDSKKKKKKDE